MSEDMLRAIFDIERQHVPDDSVPPVGPYCKGCHWAWPCAPVRLARLVRTVPAVLSVPVTEEKKP